MRYCVIWERKDMKPEQWFDLDCEQLSNVLYYINNIVPIGDTVCLIIAGVPATDIKE